jgi:hypothetical protein
MYWCLICVNICLTVIFKLYIININIIIIIIIIIMALQHFCRALAVFSVS